MAAYELRTQAPAMLQVPDSVNQGSRNLMQFMRSQQEQRNAQDRLALEQQNAENLKQFRASQLNLDQQRTDNQQQNFVANQQLNNDKFAWDKGAADRQIAQNQQLNDALNSARTGAQAQLAEGWTVDESNIDAFNQFAEANNIAVDDRAAVLRDYIGKMQNNMPQQVGKKAYEQSLRNAYSKTGATTEQVDSAIDAELQRVFPQENRELALALAGGSRGNSRSQGKLPGMDDVGNITDEAEFMKAWAKEANVESGDGASMFNPATWFGDWGKTDLTEQNVAQAVGTMRRNGFNAVETAQALELIRDGDTVDPVEFQKVLNNDPSSVVIQEANNIRNIKYGASNTNGQGGQGSQFGGLLSTLMNQNQPTTQLQRREVLLGMLQGKVQQAQAGGPGSEQAAAEAQQLQQTLQGNTNTALDAQQVLPSNQAPNTRSQVSADLAQLLGGKQNGAEVQKVFDAVGVGVDTFGGQVGNTIFDVKSALSNTIDERGVAGLFVDGIKNTPAGMLTSAIASIGTDSSPQEQIASLQNELKWMNTSNPNSAGARRAAVIQKEIQALQALMSQQ